MGEKTGWGAANRTLQTHDCRVFIQAVSVDICTLRIEAMRVISHSTPGGFHAVARKSHSIHP